MKGKREESDRNNREKVAGPLFTYLSFLFLSFFSVFSSRPWSFLSVAILCQEVKIVIVPSALMDHECCNLFSGKSIWKVHRGFIHSTGNHSKTTKSMQ